MNEIKKRVLKNKVERDGKPVEVEVKRPNHHQIQEAQTVHNRAFRVALEGKVLLKECLDKHLREQGLWDDERQAKADKLTKTLLDGEKKLQRRNIKLSEAKQIAFDIQDANAEMFNLLSERRSLEACTAQAQAENEKFNYLVSVCTVYSDTGKRVFASLDDYLSRSTEDYANEAAVALAEMIFGYDKEAEKKKPENAFLLKYGFARYEDGKILLVNKEGKLVDRDGRLIDKDGHFLNEKGERIDRDGNRVDDDGNYIFEDAGSFLDEDGNPIPEPGSLSAADEAQKKLAEKLDEHKQEFHDLATATA